MPDREGEYSIKVDNIPQGVTSDDLYDLFKSSFSTIVDVFLPPLNGATVFGFVRFSSYDDAVTASQSLGLEIKGSSLVIELAATDPKRGGDSGCYGADTVNGNTGVGWSGFGSMGAPAITDADGMGGMAAAWDAWGGKGGDGKDGWSTAGQSWGGCAPGFVDTRKTHPAATQAKALAQAAAPASISVKVGNIARDTTFQDLRVAFEEAGITGITDTYVPGSKAFGFVRFESEVLAREALRCNGMVIKGASVILEIAESKKKTSTQMAEICGSTPTASDAWNAPAPAEGGSWNSWGYNAPAKGMGMGNMGGMGMGNMGGMGMGDMGCMGMGGMGMGGMGDMGMGGMGDMGGMGMAKAFGKGKDISNMNVTDYFYYKGAYEFAMSMGMSKGHGFEAMGFGTGKSSGGGDQGFDMGFGGGKGFDMACGGKGFDMGFEGGKGGTFGGGKDGEGKGGKSWELTADHNQEVSVRVNDLPDGTTADGLKEALELQGVQRMSDVYIPPRGGFGFVRFRNHDKGYQFLNSSVLFHGKVLRLEPASGSKKRGDYNNNSGAEGPAAQKAKLD